LMNCFVKSTSESELAATMIGPCDGVNVAVRHDRPDVPMEDRWSMSSHDGYTATG